MDRRMMCLGLVALLESAALHGAEEPPMSEDVRRMHERLVLLGEGEGSMSDLRIELMDGGMAAHRSVVIEGGKLTSKEWKSPGSQMIQLEGDVSESRVSGLLRKLIERQYWGFQGTRFVPDAPMFLFRFYYGDLKHVDFRCDAAEFRESEARGAIRELFLDFVSETEMRPVERPF